MKKRFPDTETRLLIGCSDGKKYSIDALQALDEEGYTNMVGLRVSYLSRPPMAPQHVTQAALLEAGAEGRHVQSASRKLCPAMLPGCNLR